MEYQKIINLLDNRLNQLPKFRAKKWVEINGDSHEPSNIKIQIKFKTSMLKSILYYYFGLYILFKGTITIAPAPATVANP